MNSCRDCEHAILDYEEYHGGREYFVDGCKKDYFKEDEDDDCPFYVWRKDDEE